MQAMPASHVCKKIHLIGSQPDTECHELNGNQGLYDEDDCVQDQSVALIAQPHQAIGGQSSNNSVQHNEGECCRHRLTCRD